MPTFAIACGGTGGHLFPGLAVARACLRRGHNVLLFVSRKPVDREILAANPDLPAVALSTTGWTGLHPRVPTFLLNFWRGLQESRSALRQHHVAAVLGMGGFTCAPPLLEARRLGLPAFLHESNAIPGKVTRWFGPRLDKVLLGLPACAEHLPNCRTVVTGTPVRDSLIRLEPGVARSHFSLDPNRFTIAVMGGSQGAAGLNEMMLRAAADLADIGPQLQVIHLTGPTDKGLMHANYQRAGIKAEVLPFCHEMEKVYSAADLVVARSGASSGAELAHYGLPSILVPYPEAAEDHQTRNAEVFVRAGAARLVPQKRDEGAPLARAIRDLFENAAERRAMGEAARRIAPTDATARIVQELEHAVA
ncbi:MAG: undecaprenyldiphospho-muramoylpentapeptide beta-N-acetylglucosaminyltransferase [Candidatus Methylacidiphilales bacterium]